MFYKRQYVVSFRDATYDPYGGYYRKMPPELPAVIKRHGLEMYDLVSMVLSLVTPTGEFEYIELAIYEILDEKIRLEAEDPDMVEDMVEYCRYLYSVISTNMCKRLELCNVGESMETIRATPHHLLIGVYDESKYHSFCGS